MWRWLRANRGSSPEQEADRLFEDVEWGRSVVMQSHQVVHLTGEATGDLGFQPTPQELRELRALLQSACTAVLKEKPDSPLGGYMGFFLYDPFDDDHIQELSEIPNFSRPRDVGDKYYLYGGVLRRASTDTLHPAVELEEWLKKLWVKHCKYLPPEV